jgi:hypothetical protein
VQPLWMTTCPLSLPHSSLDMKHTVMVFPATIGETTFSCNHHFNFIGQFISG